MTKEHSKEIGMIDREMSIEIQGLQEPIEEQNNIDTKLKHKEVNIALRQNRDAFRTLWRGCAY